MTWRSKRALGIVLGLVLLGLWLYTPLMRQLRTQVWNVWVTTLARIASIGPLNVSAGVQSRLESLTAENIRLHSELKDYARLRHEIGASAFDDFKPLPALIVGRPIDTFQSQVVINRGAQDGVTLGAPAVVTSSVLVGFVSQVQPHSAVVTFLFHPQTTLAAEVVTDSSRIPQGLIKGIRYTTVHLTTVPRDFPFVEGQAVVTSGKPNEVPHGLLIGHIKRFISDETSIYQEAVLDVPYDPDTIKALVILRAP